MMKTHRGVCVAVGLVLGLLGGGFASWLSSPPIPGLLFSDPSERAEVVTQWRVGTLLAFYGNIESLPDSWMRCAGQPLKTASYPSLYAILGDEFVKADTKEREFRLPDYRGMVAQRSESMPRGVLHGNLVTTTQEEETPWQAVPITWIIRVRNSD